MIKKYIFIFIMGILLCSCAGTTRLERNSDQTVRLQSEGTVYVSLSADGRYGDIVYNGSGLAVNQAIAAAFMHFADKVEQATKTETQAEALESAQKISATYAAFPSILHWEDRSTEWSGISDKIEIRMRILDVKDGSLIDKAIITGKSSWWTLGGDHPQDMLDKPINQYVTQLYVKDAPE